MNRATGSRHKDRSRSNTRRTEGQTVGAKMIRSRHGNLIEIPKDEDEAEVLTDVDG